MKKIITKITLFITLFIAGTTLTSCGTSFEEEMNDIEKVEITYGQREYSQMCFNCMLNRKNDGINGRFKFDTNHYIGTDGELHCYKYYGVSIKNDSIEKHYGDTIKPYIPIDENWETKISDFYTYPEEPIIDGEYWKDKLIEFYKNIYKTY